MAVAASLFVGCGGGDDDSDDVGGTQTASTPTSISADGLVTCLNSGGIEAKQKGWFSGGTERFTFTGANVEIMHKGKPAASAIVLSDAEAERFQRTKEPFISTIPLIGKNIILSPAVGGKASFADGQPAYPEPITEAIENCVS